MSKRNALFERLRQGRSSLKRKNQEQLSSRIQQKRSLRKGKWFLYDPERSLTSVKQLLFKKKGSSLLVKSILP